MGRKTKYCLNYIKGKHENDKQSQSRCYCSQCYDEVKKRLESIGRQGGRVEGLRSARMLAGGSFGYENNPRDKERNLQAFFYYVMPEISSEKANILAKNIAYSNTVELPAQNGTYKKVKIY